MSPRARTSPPANGPEPTTTSSSPLQPAPKRRRSASRDDDESETYQVSSSSSSSEDESESDENANAESPSRTTENLAEGCGTLESIECIDFMSHKNFKIDFHPNITFITGPNGSGKSSIVAALQVCLGLKAADTKRGDSLSQLIRNGSNGAATVRVTLTNRGPDAYKPDEFGESIVVERVIGPANKGNSHRLLSKSLKPVKNESTTSAVKALCNRWQLYVDNPCCILDQESAKAFLKSSPDDMYNFALKASNLSTVGSNLESESNARHSTMTELKRLHATLPNIELQYKTAQRELDEIQHLSHLQERLQHAESVVLWSVVVEAENLAKADQAKVDAKKAALQEAASELATEEHKAAQIQRDSDTITARLEAARKAVDEAQARVKKAAQGKRDALQPSKLVEREIDTISNEMRTERTTITGIRRDIDKIRAEIAKKLSNEAQRKTLQDISNKESRLSELENRVHEQSLDRMMEHADNLRGELASNKEQFDLAKSMLKSKEEELRSLLQAKEAPAVTTNKATMALYKFGNWVPKLVEAIEANGGRFSKPPVLIGTKVKLHPNRREWAVAIDRVLGKYMPNFVVNSQADAAQVYKLAEQVRVPKSQLSVVVRSFTGVKHQVPETSFLTVLKAVDISDVEVHNVLIDQWRIEGLALIQGYDEAKQRIWLGAPTDRRLPPNILSGIGADGTSFSIRGRSEFWEAPSGQAHGYFTDPGMTQGPASAAARAPPDHLESNIAECRREIENLKHQCAVYDRDSKMHTEKLDQATRAIAEYEANTQATQREMTQLKSAIGLLREAQDELKQDSKQLAIEELEHNIAEREARIRMLQEELEKNQALKIECKSKIEPFEAAEAVAQHELEQANEELGIEEERYTQLAEKYRPSVEKKKQAEEKIRIVRDQLAAAEAKAQQSHKSAQEKEAQALKDAELSGTGGRVETTLTPQKAEAERNSLANMVRKENERISKGGEEPSVRIVRVTEAAKRAKLRYEKVKEDIATVESRAKMLKEAMKRRKARMKGFQEFIQDRTSQFFSMYLSSRGNSGKCEFIKPKGDKPGHIKIKWERSRRSDMTQEDEDDGADDFDAKQLSGGERSYTSLALLLAMGLSCETPFRVMDEFDVFMDAQSRAIAIEELIKDAAPPGSAEHTKNAVKGRPVNSRQNIFITPLDIEKAVPERPYIKKLTLAPAEASFGAKGGR